MGLPASGPVYTQLLTWDGFGRDRSKGGAGERVNNAGTAECVTRCGRERGGRWLIPTVGVAHGDHGLQDLIPDLAAQQLVVRK